MLTLTRSRKTLLVNVSIFMTALKVGHDYRASLAFFLASPLTAKQLAQGAHKG